MQKKRLKSADITIISNNCWDSMIYESHNLSKESPTVGMFFMTKDYIEFLSDLKGYVKGKLTFIMPEESRWNKLLVKFNDQNGCTETEVNKLMEIPFKNKLIFTSKYWTNEMSRDTVIRQFPKYEVIMALYELFGKSRHI